METPKPHGIPQPKSSAWLEGVKLDATRAAIENITRQVERKEYQEAKAKGLTPADMIANAKARLGATPEAEATPEQPKAPKGGK